MTKPYNRIPDELYAKLRFQARGQIGAILNAFRCYGLDPYVDKAIEECMKITENFAMAVRGKDKPISILSKPRKRITE